MNAWKVNNMDYIGSDVIAIQKKSAALKLAEIESELKMKKYEWFPKDTSQELFEKYLSSLNENKRPIKGTQGAEYRKREMERQLPMHDFDFSVCDSVSSEYDREKFNLFIKDHEKPSIGLGEIKENHSPSLSCCACKELIDFDDVFICIKHDETKVWHSSCFKCNSCNELLVDLIYFYKNNTIYCGRHFSELIRPRCAACDELIFSKEYTKAESQSWHLNHFCCWKCDRPLGGTKYLVLDAKPYCIECNEDNFSKSCDSCHVTISVDLPRLTFNNTHWHSDPKCFSCFTCRKSLVNEKFIFKSGCIFCSIDCKRRIIPKNSSKFGDVVKL